MIMIIITITIMIMNVEYIWLTSLLNAKQVCSAVSALARPPPLLANSGPFLPRLVKKTFPIHPWSKHIFGVWVPGKMAMM